MICFCLYLCLYFKSMGNNLGQNRNKVCVCCLWDDCVHVWMYIFIIVSICSVFFGRQNPPNWDNTQSLNGHVFNSRWVLHWVCTHSSEAEHLIAEQYLFTYVQPNDYTYVQTHGHWEIGKPKIIRKSNIFQLSPHFLEFVISRMSLCN